MRVGRNLLDAAEGFLQRKRYLILDRDPLHGSVPKDASRRQRKAAAAPR
jgi:hypothetical protein